MNHILNSTRIIRPRSGFFTTLLHSIGHGAQILADSRRLDSMPRDRLDDMGIAHRSDANRRSSGEQGPIPHAPMW